MLMFTTPLFRGRRLLPSPCSLHNFDELFGQLLVQSWKRIFEGNFKCTFIVQEFAGVILQISGSSQPTLCCGHHRCWPGVGITNHEVGFCVAQEI